MSGSVTCAHWPGPLFSVMPLALEFGYILRFLSPNGPRIWRFLSAQIALEFCDISAQIALEFCDILQFLAQIALEFVDFCDFWAQIALEFGRFLACRSPNGPRFCENSLYFPPSFPFFSLFFPFFFPLVPGTDKIMSQPLRRRMGAVVICYLWNNVEQCESKFSDLCLWYVLPTYRKLGMGNPLVSSYLTYDLSFKIKL